MIKHIAMWRLKLDEGMSREAAFDIIRDTIAAQRGRIPGLLESEAGLNFSTSGKALDVVVYTVFTDRAALQGYHQHPVHMETRARMDRFLSAGCMVDYEVDSAGASATA
ncbi:Stress responsive A/B Barrel Domain protein [Pigmentiphaga humi]|uniref:Stress responsive A/B Barrel Domain protein n=1 Tax=Pigmentiphaga humi TaxID=2478468 RepID=A0A3P4B289_9BURK|nr:Dabb family protein [Pigmentiphaga humi]VCU70399.1 Stress responsive A/B Barrel Domain protein [Pigmentiphaga humi]